MSEKRLDPLLDQETVRQSFDLPAEMHEKLSHWLPYGTKRHFMIRIVELALEGMETGGYEVVGAILQGDFNPLAEAVRKNEERRNKE
jgi:hypothetical protein